jgi:hypothetical protein
MILEKSKNTKLEVIVKKKQRGDYSETCSESGADIGKAEGEAPAPAAV